MAAVFEVSAEDINDDSSSDTIVLWNSLKHMQLVVALEEEFDSYFTDEEIVRMKNYSKIIEVIKEK